MTALVGRADELNALNQLIDGAVAGHGASALLAGDAGVGKTRLLGELADRDDVTLVKGHCIDFGEARLPYLPFTEIFGRLGRVQTTPLVAEFPALTSLLPGGRDAAEPDKIDRGALFDGVLGALLTLARDQPLLVIIEDVHWADQATRDLIGFLFARIGGHPVALLVSYRTDDLHRRHPLRPMLAQWARLTDVLRVQLAPLSQSEVRALISGLAMAPLEDSQLEQIVERAEGNAFFAEELTSATVHAADGASLPAELADLLLIRLDRLTDQARRVVGVAAVAGRRVPHDVLASVAGLSQNDLGDALRAAFDAHILESESDRVGYGFRHALLAEAVYDDLLAGERVRLHAAYLQTLRNQSGGGAAAELAHHARQSHDLLAAFELSVRAGQQAMSLAAPAEAMIHFQAALELEGQGGQVDLVQLSISAADAASDAGHPVRALTIARDAVNRLSEGASRRDQARLLYNVGLYALNTDGDGDAFEATAQAMRLLPEHEPFRARTSALHARAAMALGRDVDAARWANEAIGQAVVNHQPDVAFDARTTLAILQRRTGDPVGAATELRRTAEQARLSGDLTTELRTRYSLGGLYYEQGDLDDAVIAYGAGLRRGAETGRQWAAYAIECRLLTGLIHYERGEWDECLATVDSAGQNPPAPAAATLRAIALAVRAGRGDADALTVLPSVRDRWPRDGMLVVLTAAPTAELLSYLNRPDDAMAVLDDAVDMLTRLWQSEWFLGRVRLAALALAILAAHVSQQPQSRRQAIVADAGQLIAAARSTAEKGLPAGRVLGVEAIAWLARAEAEWARLRWLAGVDGAPMVEHVQLWKRAVDAFGYGHVYEQARSRTRLAAVLRAAGELGEATEQANQARQVARELKAEPLLAEIRSLRVRAPKSDANGDPQTLTNREHEVLALLVLGRTNRLIAQQLYISEKTVSVHVSNILAKLGVRNRAEAAALARRDGGTG
jgi:DNA-binding CsgD family transcriptional regulator